MESNNWSNELESLLVAYDDGLYTAGEVASSCLDFLDAPNTVEVWKRIPDWVQSRLISRLRDFSEDDEVVAFGQGDSKQAKDVMLRVKEWMTSQGLI